MKNLSLPIMALCAMATLNGCTFPDAPRYGDRKVIFVAPDTQKAAPKQPCDMRGNVVARSDKNCVGQVIKSPDGPTITVLTPGVAVPTVDVDAASLEPLKR